MKTVKTILITAAITLAVALAAFWGLSHAANGQAGPQVSALKLQGAIADMGELATAEYAYRLTQFADKEGITIIGITLPFTSSKVLYSYEGLIKAGIDFQAVTVTLDEAAKTVTIRLPQAEIVSSEVDFDSLVVYDAQYSPFNTFTFEDMNLSLADLQVNAESAAMENGLLERAAANAQNLLKTFIAGLLDTQEYTVRFA